MAGRQPFPFLWGAATSSHQVEGGNTGNDWYDWELAPGSGCAEPSGTACDHLHRYPEDIAILAQLGLNCYRFSLEWSRVEPEPGRYAEHWLGHYRAVATCCREHGLYPMLTLHHFTNPRWLSARGGWERQDTATAFGRLCEVVVEALGDVLAAIVTINEPNIVALLGYQDGVFPPGKRDGGARIKVTQTFVDAHRQAVDVVRAKHPELPVGLALAMADWQALPGGEAERDHIRHLREDVFLDATAGDDFIGVNTYTRHRIGPAGWVGNDPAAELTAAGYEFWPEALEATLGYASARGRGVPLIVTESGVATGDDMRRVEYIDRSVAAMRRAIDAGADVRGFIYWSALDNFEWNHGYAQRFGLLEVDRLTQERTVKPSAWHLGRLAAAWG